MFSTSNYQVSKKINHKDKVNNFVVVLEKSVSSSCDIFIAFMRGVPNHNIDDESLKDYFYRGKDDNNKAILDTIAVAPMGNVPMLRL